MNARPDGPGEGVTGIHHTVRGTVPADFFANHMPPLQPSVGGGSSCKGAGSKVRS